MKCLPRQPQKTAKLELSTIDGPVWAGKPPIAVESCPPPVEGPSITDDRNLGKSQESVRKWCSTPLLEASFSLSYGQLNQTSVWRVVELTPDVAGPEGPTTAMEDLIYVI
jgi:hypothetical protein